jgi:MFS family permease
MWGIPAALFGIAFFHRAAPGIIARELMQAFGATGALVGLLSATYYYAYAGLMVPAGVLLDTSGVPRVVAAGGALMGLGSLAMAAAETTPVLFGGRLLIGLGASVTFVGALKIAAAWFPPDRFATLSATTATVGTVGSLLATVPLAALVGAAGWRGALAAVGVLTLAGAAACWLVVRDRPDPTPRPSFAQALRGTRTVLANRHTWPPFAAFFFLIAGSSNLWLWTVPFLRDVYGLSTTEAAWYATAPSFAVLIAGPATGFLSDRVLHRRKLPWIVLDAVLLAAWLGLVLTLGRLPLAGLYALLFTMGVAASGFVLTWPIGREVNAPHLAGVAVAVVNVGGFVAAALSQGLVGWVLDARWQGATDAGARVYPAEAYVAAFGVCTLFVLGSTVATLFLRETRGENVYRVGRAPGDRS